MAMQSESHSYSWLSRGPRAERTKARELWPCLQDKDLERLGGGKLLRPFARSRFLRPSMAPGQIQGMATRQECATRFW